MGQYYYVVNLDKRQFLHPHKFGDGLKLMEFGCSGDGTMTGLAVLLADGNGRGGGDLRLKDEHPDNALVGSWAGDRIVIAGDYADEGKWLSSLSSDVLARVNDHKAREYNDPPLEDLSALSLNAVSGMAFEDISDRIIGVIGRNEGGPLSAIRPGMETSQRFDAIRKYGEKEAK